MPKAFCPDCGQPNVYGDVKPNFCGFCQASLSVSGGVTTGSRPSPVHRKRVAGAARTGRRFIVEEDEEDDEDTFDGTLPDIQELEVEVIVPKVYREKVGDVWASGATGDVRQRPKDSKEEILRKFRDRIYRKSEIDLNPNSNE